MRSQVTYVGRHPAGSLRFQVFKNTILADGSQQRRALDPAPSLEVVRHSPDGFAWGYGGSGPAQLALALLLDVGLDKETALGLYQDFKSVIAGLRENFWTMGADVIKEWVSQKQRRKTA